MKQLKPLVKWAGGKSQLLDIISAEHPDGLGASIRRYAEPFVGGGAVLFDILNKYDLNCIFISDINLELINMYKIVRDKPDDLVSLLKKYEKIFWPMGTDDRKKFYYNKRDEYNGLVKSRQTSGNVSCAAMFIFLNRTCSNGFYRVNSGYSYMS